MEGIKNLMYFAIIQFFNPRSKYIWFSLKHGADAKS
jgi:hypothetical protein